MLAPPIVRNRERQKDERRAGAGLFALGIVFAVTLYVAFDWDRQLRNPGLVGSLLLVLTGIIVFDRAGLPREQNSGSRRALGFLPMLFGGWLAHQGLFAPTSGDQRHEPVVWLAYIVGFVLFGCGGWMAFHSPSSTKPAPPSTG